MENRIYKTYKLEEILSTYINKNGISYILNKQGNMSSNEKELDTFFEITTEDDIDIQVQKDFLEDVDIPDNESTDVRIDRVKRYQKIVKLLKQKYNYKCQLCGYTFRMDNGNYYCEAHHIKMLSEDGFQSPQNVIILCANHHRMFHYATGTNIIGELIDGKRVIKIGNEEFIVQF